MHLFAPETALAIIGMEAAWGGVDNLRSYDQLVYAGGLAMAKAVAPKGWEAVAARAVENAGINTTTMRIAIIVDGRPAAADLTWASTISYQNGSLCPLADALEQARNFLSNGHDVVVYAAQADPERFSAGGEAGCGFDSRIHDWRSGSGSGALVLMDAGRARREKRHVFAVIRGAAVVQGKQNGSQPGHLPAAPALQDLKACIESALAAAQLAPVDVQCVAAYACGVDALDGIEIAALVQSYRAAGEKEIALVSAQANIGYTGAADGVAALIYAANCLSGRYLPPDPAWSEPKLPALWKGAPFYVPTAAQPWFAAAGVRRNMAVNILGRGGAALHLILQEAEGIGQDLTASDSIGGPALFPLTGDSLEDLQNACMQLRGELAVGEGLTELAARYCGTAQDTAHPLYGAAILAHSVEESLRELDLAEKALPGIFARQDEWQTPSGSYATANPVGKTGSVALVYPGAFNSYIGMGRDLFRLFPSLFTLAAHLTGDLGTVLRERQIFPRSLASLRKEEIAAQESALLADPIAMLSSGTTLSILITRLVMEILEIPVSAAFGYSLGENSMLFSTGVWRQGDQAAARLAESNVFRDRLAGPQKTIREYWHLPPQTQATRLWVNYLLMVDAEQASAAVAKEEKVFLTHINTPRQVVIGGDPDGCQRVIASLRCASLQAPFDYALHCEAIRADLPGLEWLHDWPVEDHPGLALYTAVDMATLPMDRPVIARKLAEMLASPLDFPTLVKRVYDDGARVFLEVGAGSNCSRWIDETLRSQPHLAISFNRRGTDDAHTLARATARLHCHRVPVKLTALYHTMGERIAE